MSNENVDNQGVKQLQISSKEAAFRAALQNR